MSLTESQTLDDEHEAREIARLEALKRFKRRLAEAEGSVETPFGQRVARYHAPPELDVPEIHEDVRAAMLEGIREVAETGCSQVVVLSGSPGTGKTHILNSFRDPRLQRELGYVLTCNDNYWRADEFEECLLDWLLAALRPGASGTGEDSADDDPDADLLLAKVYDVAFRALGDIIDQPRQLANYLRHDALGFTARLTARVRRGHPRIEGMIRRRDPAVFRLLDLRELCKYCTKRYLRRDRNPFHEYALNVLMRYVLPGERDHVIHWLRGRKVRSREVSAGLEAAEEHLKQELDIHESVDSFHKKVEVIRILVSLFTPDVSQRLTDGEQESAERVFLLAFDQMEARRELFQSPDDWLRFFGSLSELYNTLPNVFIVCTMTTDQRNELRERMEAQFRDRIRQDARFALSANLPDDALLTLYRRRLSRWLGGDAETRDLLDTARQPCLPFEVSEALDIGRQGTRTIRNAMLHWERGFRERVEQVRVGPDLDYKVELRNERREIMGDRSRVDPPALRAYAEDHLNTLEALFSDATFREVWLQGLHCETARQTTETGQLPALLVTFSEGDQWVRVFFVHLPYKYAARIPGALELLSYKQRARYSLSLDRVGGIKEEDYVPEDRADQVIATDLTFEDETILRTLPTLTANRSLYERDQCWGFAVELMRSEVESTYLRGVLDRVRTMLAELGSADGEDLPGTKDPAAEDPGAEEPGIEEPAAEEPGAEGESPESEETGVEDGRP